MSRWIYEINNDNSARFILGERGGNPLVCIGVNPSTATPEKLDPTLRQVKNRAERMGYDGWIMLNLYPQRATNPNDLHEIPNIDLAAQNLATIARYLLDFREITLWAAWGTLITKRNYLTKELRIINDALNMTLSGQKRSWISIGSRSQSGHPHHPLYLPKDSEIKPFDIKSYLDSFSENKK